MTDKRPTPQGFADTLHHFGTDEDRDAVRANAEALHDAIRTKNMPVIERYVVPWHMHIDRHGRPHEFDAWVSSLERQPERWRDAVEVIGEITISDGAALLSGYVRLDGRGVLGEVLASEVIARFTQVWANFDGVWRRISSRTNPRPATPASTP